MRGYGQLDAEISGNIDRKIVAFDENFTDVSDTRYYAKEEIEGVSRRDRKIMSMFIERKKRKK